MQCQEQWMSKSVSSLTVRPFHFSIIYSLKSKMWFWWVIFYGFFLKDFIYLFIFRERGREGDRERDTHINVWLPLMWPPLGIWSATQACTLTGNRTGDTLFFSLCSIHWAILAGVYLMGFFKLSVTRPFMYCAHVFISKLML